MFKYLNIIDEPHKVIRDIDVHKVVEKNSKKYLSFVENKLYGIANKQIDIVMPSKILFDDNNGGDFRLMPCILKDGDKVSKSIKIVGTNVTNKVIKDQICVGKAFLLHPEDNHITHIVDACILSAVRTGACAMLATKLLKNDAKSLMVVGSGRIGYYASLFAKVIGIKTVYVTDKNMEKAIEMEKCLDVKATDKIVDTDVLLLATTSKTTIFDEETNHALVISVGADTDYQTELGYNVSKRKIVVDVMDSMKFGDIKRWLTKNIIDKSQLTEMFQIMRQSDRYNNNNTLFISTGTAMFDNITIEFLKDYFI